MTALLGTPLLNTVKIGCITQENICYIVSPDDLVQAAELTGQLRLGVSLKEFPNSKVKVLQLDQCKDEAVICQRILDLFIKRRQVGLALQPSPTRQVVGEPLWLEGEKGIDAAFVSEELHLSLVIAKEQLLLAERLEHICRDESVFGVTYYPNLFKHVY
jgi:hypothetical protein